MSREARLALHVRKERRKVEKELVRGGRLGGFLKGRRDGRTDAGGRTDGRTTKTKRMEGANIALARTRATRPRTARNMLARSLLLLLLLSLTFGPDWQKLTLPKDGRTIHASE